jgi:predicted TIM-barrel fold metal-dependent hydrolase
MAVTEVAGEPAQAGTPGPARVVDVSCNLRGHTDLPFYNRVPSAKARGQEPWRCDTLLGEMDKAGIDIVGLIASVAAHGVGGAEDPIHADAVHEVVGQAPDRLFGWVGINPTKGMETLRYIEYAVTQLGFKGVHCYPHWWGVPVNDRTYYPIYAKCAELGVPIAMQVGSQTFRARAKLCARPVWLDDVAFHFPELTIIGIHVGSPWVDEMIMLCRNYENVFIMADAHPPSTWEQSLVDYMSGRGRHNVDGVTKVMWGTDWPMQTFAESLRELDDLGLTPDVRSRLVGGNALSVLGLNA